MSSGPKVKTFLVGPTLCDLDRPKVLALHYPTTRNWVDYQRWVRKLIGFDFEIQYKSGVFNRVVDAVSWKEEGELELESCELGALVSS